MIESYFKSHDHHRLYYQEWKADPSRAVLIFVHGLNEHSGRYVNPVNFFSKKGYTLYLFDHRGHGRSDGLRSFIDDFDTYLKDLDEFTLYVANREKRKKIFMIGHSMGGQIVINYVARYDHALSGFMVSSPNIEVAVKISWIKKQMTYHLSTFLPKMRFTNEIDPKWISRDRAVVRAYKSDPLVSKDITLKLASEIFKNQDKIMGFSPRVKIPVLMMHAGDDRICSAKGTEKFFQEMNSKDKTLIIYDKFYHELFNEFGKEKVFADMEGWLKKHLRPIDR